MAVFTLDRADDVRLGAAVDKNFAVHLPVLDVVFGTAYMPDRWPSAYGISGGEPPLPGYLRQLLWPFGPRT